ncbi:unnamed protein product [Bursaphelenchus okinawaensis]|uniref:Uncharacterized protein n=1 Tax=Bursaphelenchus okinawaensis TaxID=465554 RepID=A0A811L6X8_9BILA|nr:unnamed protein product [Bursaphelenchus okinawaensis]CAG9116967.1 unnamed protein product [Bursaphelenchus okinawaensis]
MAEDLMRKWKATAEKDLLHEDYSDFLGVNKGLQKFIESNDDLTESSILAQVALLNAALRHQFQGTFMYFDSERAKQCLSRFDYVLGQLAALKKSETSDQLHYYAKSSFYYRLGDYHLATLIKTNVESVDQSHLSVVVCCYSFALYHLLKGRAVTDLKTSSDQFNMLELSLLISGNLKYIGGAKALKDFMASKDLLQRMLRNAFYEKSQAFPSSNDKSFIMSDVPEVATNFVLPNVDCLKVLSEIWSSRRKTIFLNRFLWIYFNIKDLKKDGFLDDVTKLERLPKSMNLGLSIKEFTAFDLKVLLFRLSEHFNRTLNNALLLGKCVMLPSHFYPLLHKHVIRLWKILNDVVDQKSVGTSEEIHFTSALEEIRMDVVYECDKIGLLNTVGYLTEKIKISKDKEKKLYITLFDRYTQIMTQAVKGHKYSDNASCFFPHKQQLKIKMAQVWIEKGNKEKAEGLIKELAENPQNLDVVAQIEEKMREKKLVSTSPNTSQANSSILSFDTCDDSFMTAYSNGSSENGSNDTLEQSGFQIIDHPDDTAKKIQEARAKKYEKLTEIMDVYLKIAQTELDQLKKYAEQIGAV